MAKPAKRCNIDRFGVPTSYRGVMFRSRLEARWACFFDLVKWRWAYEPFDLNGYIPDFLLHFPRAPMLVEVKPLLTAEYLEPAKRKIDKSEWNDEVLILGSSFVHEDYDMPSIGIIGEIWPEELKPDRERCWGWSQECRCLKCKCLSTHSRDGSFRCRCNGCYDGDGFLGSSVGMVADAWLEAGNTVQWRPR